ncbi:GNAT family N-acetyltransferase [Alcanivorax sp. DP30]|uniref:GNAT family N-acetyltransferase n=1 Tax=Alcanivorax sp. DP30 TaxID=2606217 RepID=UPI001370CCCF|nr:GNAT family N-acetyltransferase [Alcanivorax sp. DP30]MZR62352.1 GNAT family N-acetyltransferase [Alcanivorax sp. DP30]
MLDWIRRLLGKPQEPLTPEPPAPLAEPGPPVGASQPCDQPDPLAAFLPFQIRPLEAADLSQLIGVFRDSIQVSTAGHYDQQQRDAWSRAQNHESLISLLSEGDTVVAEWDQELVGFAQRINDYINMIYVHPDSARVGIATLMYQHLEDGARVEGVDALSAHVSLTAHDFFQFMGFDSEGEEQADRNGVTLTRHRMRKSLVTN